MIKKIINKLKNIFKKINSCFYVGASNILPPPLTKEAEREYLIAKNAGDEEAKAKLIEHNLRLVVYLAKRFEGTKYDLEDLVSIGSIGLIKGVNTYKMEKNIKLATYVSRCIDNEILMFLRKNKKTQRDISLDASLAYDGEGNELHLEDILGTDANIVSKNIEKATEKDIMREEISKLDSREKDIMCMRYGLFGKKEMTQKDVANFLNISQSYISRIEKKVIKRIRSIVKQIT